jgi:hypothetical protein
MNSTPIKLLLLAILFVTRPSVSDGASISWNSNFQSVLIDSAGNPLEQSFSFEMGTFGGFAPTYANMSDWASNWKVFDKAYLDDPNGWNWENSFFTRSVTHEADGTSSSPFANPPNTLSPNVFSQNETVYLWVYNTKTLAEGAEWALVTDGLSGDNTYGRWLIPDPSESSASYEWHLDDARELVVGGANNVRGAGQFSANPSIFSLQTAAVPEPTSALLVLSALGWLGWPGRRRASQNAAR